VLVVRDNFSLVAIGIVFVSVLPMVVSFSPGARGHCRSAARRS
jgi:hypothetical protein